MCGRISQYEDLKDYYRGIGLSEAEMFEKMPPPRRFNVSPGTDVAVIHRLQDHIEGDALRWGYFTSWHEKTKKKPSINAMIEKAEGAFWKALWKTGRVIVPADGWYEWTLVDGKKQPWFIKKKDGEPMYIAALTGKKPGWDDQKYGAGMALVTTESAGGMVDVHDRRPIVLNPEDARMWLDLSKSGQETLEFVRKVALPSDAFDWYQVTRDVNKAGNQSPEMVEPMS